MLAVAVYLGLPLGLAAGAFVACMLAGAPVARHTVVPLAPTRAVVAYAGLLQAAGYAGAAKALRCATGKPGALAGAARFGWVVGVAVAPCSAVLLVAPWWVVWVPVVAVGGWCAGRWVGGVHGYTGRVVQRGV